MIPKNWGFFIVILKVIFEKLITNVDKISLIIKYILWTQRR